MCRTPDPGNSKVFSSLSESQQQQLSNVQQLAEVYSHNACTPDIHQYLVDRVQAVGLFGMLRECTVPLMHCGYKPGPFQDGADLQKLHMSLADAEGYRQLLLRTVLSCTVAIHGQEQLPSSSTPPLLMQSVVDLMCCNWDRVKLLQSAPAGQREAAGIRSAAEAVTNALQAAAAVAAAAARGDSAAAEEAAVAAQQAQQLTAAAEDSPELLLPEEIPDPPELLLPAREDIRLSEATAPAVLQRGTGLVYLLSKDWGGRAKLLDAAVKVGDKVFTHMTLGMLTARKGLSLEQKKQRQVPLRVSLDFLSGGSSSSWGAQAVIVPNDAHLLLWGKALQPIPGRMSNTEVLPGYEVLYGDALGSASIVGALGEGSEPISKRIHARTPLVQFV